MIYTTHSLNVSFDGVKDAYSHLSRIFDETPLVFLDERDVAGRRIRVYGKLESTQATCSFKSRGSEYFIQRAAEQYENMMIQPRRSLDRPRTMPEFVTASAGNHGQGVALAAKRRGLEAHIFVPVTTPDVKVERAGEKLGAHIYKVGESFDQSLQSALEYAQPRGRVFVHPYQHQDIIHGQGTIAVELLARTCPHHNMYWRFYGDFKQEPWDVPDVIVTPVGGGGLSVGMGVVVQDFREHAEYNMRLVGVQTENADSMHRSFHTGELLPSSTSLPSVADGICVRQASQEMFDLARKYVDDIVLVSEAEIVDAMRNLRYNPNLQRDPWYMREKAIPGRMLSEGQRIYSSNRVWNKHEGASSAAYAGVGKLDYDKLGIDKPEINVVCVLTGSNIDDAKFEHLTYSI